MKAWRLPALLLCLISGTSLAHPLAPALLQITQGEGQRYDILWRLSPLQSSQQVPQPQLPAHCQPLNNLQTRVESNAAFSQRWSIDCGEQGLREARIGVSHLDVSGINVILRIQFANGEALQHLLSAEQSSWQLPAVAQAGAVFGSYLQLGVEHLVFGPDHLLFLLGLLILVSGARRLVLTLTAFTLGHSITLSLAALGIIQVSQALMELGIAISLLVLARELLRQSPSVLGRRPAVMAAAFGLLHGLGFAGALAEIGLPQTEVVSALLGFNLGIELGQLFIAACVILLTVGMRRIRYKDLRLQSATVGVSAYIMGSLAILWSIERFSALTAWRLPI